MPPPIPQSVFPDPLCNALAIVWLHRMLRRVAGLGVASNVIRGPLPARDIPRLSDILSPRGAFRLTNTEGARYGGTLLSRSPVMFRLRHVTGTSLALLQGWLTHVPMRHVG
jgi:hypothetical protein